MCILRLQGELYGQVDNRQFTHKRKYTRALLFKARFIANLGLVEILIVIYLWLEVDFSQDKV